MPRFQSPRQALKGLLQGIPPDRPLFLPIVFSLGARVENVPLREFLYNPTKICSALRQIRGYLPADGVACYFDSTLEAEALGAALEWNGDLQAPEVLWPQPGGPAPRSLPPVEQVVQKGRIPVACEVIRRLKSMVTQDCLLMAGVTGAFTLGSGLAVGDEQSGPYGIELAPPVLEFAASLITEIVTRYVEAGADVIFIVEKGFPPISAERCEQWASLLAPAFNIARFYEALPVLLLTDASSVAASREALSNSEWNCVLCSEIRGIKSGPVAPALQWRANLLGMALPANLFTSDELGPKLSIDSIRTGVSELKPVILTTASDLPTTVDMKQASNLLRELKRL
jgi:hypothetical protein